MQNTSANRPELLVDALHDGDGSVISQNLVARREAPAKPARLNADDITEALSRLGLPGHKMLASLGRAANAIDVANACADAAEVEFLDHVAERFACRDLSQRDLARIYEAYRSIGRRGFAERWNSIVPFSTGRIAQRLFSEPHTDGRWYGLWPLAVGAATPEPGQPVVYHLYDPDGTRCYIGSTGDFRVRMQRHRYDGKDFSSWMAEPHLTRGAAFFAEDELLKSLTELPKYNQMARR